jgi:hypothetical protein
MLARCNAAIERGELAGVPPFHILGILDRGDYGWVEYLSTPACSDELAVARFYRRQGALLALLHVLLGTDIHHENLIAHGEHPVVVALEALFHPFIIASEPSASTRSNAEAALEHSVLRIGVLPWRALRSEGNPGINVGALGEGEVQPLPFRSRAGRGLAATTCGWSTWARARRSAPRGRGALAGPRRRRRSSCWRSRRQATRRAGTLDETWDARDCAETGASAPPPEER